MTKIIDIRKEDPREKKAKKMGRLRKGLLAPIFILLAIICFAAPFPSWIYSIVKSVQFNASCGGYLEMAADANSVDIAEGHLTTAITYLEEHDLTHGYTKIFVYKPTNDIGLWYNNLKTAQYQLQEMIKNADSNELEKSNMLMKLRETLLDEDGCLTLPMGIERAKEYTLTFWLNVTLCILWIGGGVCCYFAHDMISYNPYEYYSW